MSICSKTKDSLYGLLSEPDNEPQDVRTHVASCTDCGQDMRDLEGFLRSSQEALELIPADVERELAERSDAGIRRFASMRRAN